MSLINYPNGVSSKYFNESDETSKCKTCDTVFMESELNDHQRCDDCQHDHNVELRSDWKENE